MTLSRDIAPCPGDRAALPLARSLLCRCEPSRRERSGSLDEAHRAKRRERAGLPPRPGEVSARKVRLAVRMCTRCRAVRRGKDSSRTRTSGRVCSYRPGGAHSGAHVPSRPSGRLRARQERKRGGAGSEKYGQRGESPSLWNTARPGSSPLHQRNSIKIINSIFTGLREPGRAMETTLFEANSALSRRPRHPRNFRVEIRMV